MPLDGSLSHENHTRYQLIEKDKKSLTSDQGLRIALYQCI
jgi:hypothetical protein